MGAEAIIVAVIAAGGTGAAALFAWLINRRKVPAEVDSIVVTGAESAVLSLQKSNEVLTRRAEHAEAEGERLRERLALRDAEIEELKAQLTAARQQIDDVLRRLEESQRDEA